MPATVHYTIEVEVREMFAPGLKALSDAVAERLEREGAIDTDYEVVTHGPPELRIGWR